MTKSSKCSVSVIENKRVPCKTRDSMFSIMSTKPENIQNKAKEAQPSVCSQIFLVDKEGYPDSKRWVLSLVFPVPEINY